jgi:hypothetical protein
MPGFFLPGPTYVDTYPVSIVLRSAITVIDWTDFFFIIIFITRSNKPDVKVFNRGFRQYWFRL